MPDLIGGTGRKLNIEIFESSLHHPQVIQMFYRV